MIGQKRWFDLDDPRSVFGSDAEITLGGDQPELDDQFDGDNYPNLTIVTGLKPRDRILQEEVFGPMITSIPFDTEEEAIELANGVTYNHSVTVQTRDPGRAVQGDRRRHGLGQRDFFVWGLRFCSAA